MQGPGTNLISATSPISPNTELFRTDYRMQKLIRLSIFSLLFFPKLTGAQNTVGGVRILVPEAEVKRQSQFLNAERERLLGRWDKALEAYKEIVYKFPDNDAAWYGLARTYSATNDVVNAANAAGFEVILAAGEPPARQKP